MRREMPGFRDNLIRDQAVMGAGVADVDAEGGHDTVVCELARAGSSRMPGTQGLHLTKAMSLSKGEDRRAQDGASPTRSSPFDKLSVIDK